MKKIPYSLVSGIMAIALFFAPFASSVTFAAEVNNESVRADIYDEDYHDGYEIGLDYGEEDGYYDALDGYPKNPRPESYLAGDVTLEFQKGFLDGYEIGYEEGYLEGLEDGEDYYYDDYEEGYDDGVWDGFDQGYDDGFDGKKQDNSFTLDEDADEEYNKGYAEGYPEGYEEGYQEGKEDKEFRDNRPSKQEIKDPVTGDVYYDYYLDKKTVEDFKTKEGYLQTEKTRSINLEEDAIKAIKEHAIFITSKGTLIKFPKSALEQVLKIVEQDKEEGDDISIDLGFHNVTNQYTDALSEAIDFSLLAYTSNNKGGSVVPFQGKLDTPITVSFFVNKDKVKNWGDLTLIYVDENGKETNYANQVKSINPETGEVVVEIDYFHTYYSTYYIAEVTGKGAGAGVIVEPSKPGQGGSGEGKPGNDVTVNGQGGSAGTGEEGNDVTINGQGGSAGTGVDGQTLPVTATNSYNLLIAGALTLALGLGTIVFYRRKQAL